MAKRDNCNDTVIRREIRSDDTHSYVYELTMSEGRHVSSFRIPLYTVKVEMTDRFGEKRTGKVRDAFADAGKAIMFFDKAVRNMATPIDLAYLSEDER